MRAAPPKNEYSIMHVLIAAALIVGAGSFWSFGTSVPRAPASSSGSDRADAERELRKAEKMRNRLLRKLARYHLSDAFLREREMIGALVLRQKLEKIEPKTRDEVRALLVEESGRVRALIEEPALPPELRVLLTRYLKDVEKLAAQNRHRSGPVDSPESPETDDPEEGEGDGEER